MANDNHWAAALKLATAPPQATLSARQRALSPSIQCLLPAPSSKTVSDEGVDQCDDEQHALRLLTFAENRATIRRLEEELRSVLADQRGATKCEHPLADAVAPPGAAAAVVAPRTKAPEAAAEADRAAAHHEAAAAAGGEPDRPFTPRRAARSLKAAGDAARIAERALLELHAGPAPPMPPPTLPAAWRVSKHSEDGVRRQGSHLSTSIPSDERGDNNRGVPARPRPSAAEEAGGKPLSAATAARRNRQYVESAGKNALDAGLVAVKCFTPAQIGFGADVKKLMTYQDTPAPPMPPARSCTGELAAGSPQII